jgi:hypothetical protein
MNNTCFFKEQPIILSIVFIIFLSQSKKKKKKDSAELLASLGNLNLSGVNMSYDPDQDKDLEAEFQQKLTKNFNDIRTKLVEEANSTLFDEDENDQEDPQPQKVYFFSPYFVFFFC